MKNHVTPRHTARPSRFDLHKSHAECACNFRDVYYSKNRKIFVIVKYQRNVFLICYEM